MRGCPYREEVIAVMKVRGAFVGSRRFGKGQNLGVFVSMPRRNIEPSISPSNEVCVLAVDRDLSSTHPVSKTDRFDILKDAEQALSSDEYFADLAGCQLLVLFDEGLSTPVIVKRFGDFKGSVDVARNEVVSEMVKVAMTDYEPGEFDLGAGGARLAGTAKRAAVKVADDIKEVSRRYAEEIDGMIPKGEVVESGPRGHGNDVEEYANLLLDKTSGPRFRGVVIESKGGKAASCKRFSAWPFGKWPKDDAEVLEGKIARDYGSQDALLCVIIDVNTGEYALVRFDSRSDTRIVGKAAARAWAWENMSFCERYNLMFAVAVIAGDLDS